MSEAMLVALTGVGIAAVNMIGTVLLMWIRAHYRWRNGTAPPDRPDPPAPP